MSTAPQFTAARRRGYSTIEIFGVLAIMMLLTAVGYAGLRIYERNLPLRTSAQRVVQAFSAARAYAVARNSVYSVQIDSVRGQFWIDETDANGTTLTPKVVRLETIDEKVQLELLQFNENEPNLQVTAMPVRFYPDGSSDDVKIYLQLRAGVDGRDLGVATVRLYGPTGQARIFENERLEGP